MRIKIVSIICIHVNHSHFSGSVGSWQCSVDAGGSKLRPPSVRHRKCCGFSGCWPQRASAGHRSGGQHLHALRHQRRPHSPDMPPPQRWRPLGALLTGSSSPPHRLLRQQNHHQWPSRWLRFYGRRKKEKPSRQLVQIWVSWRTII